MSLTFEQIQKHFLFIKYCSYIGLDCFLHLKKANWQDSSIIIINLFLTFFSLKNRSSRENLEKTNEGPRTFIIFHRFILVLIQLLLGPLCNHKKTFYEHEQVTIVHFLEYKTATSSKHWYNGDAPFPINSDDGEVTGVLGKTSMFPSHLQNLHTKISAGLLFWFPLLAFLVTSFRLGNPLTEAVTSILEIICKFSECYIENCLLCTVLDLPLPFGNAQKLEQVPPSHTKVDFCLGSCTFYSCQPVRRGWTGIHAASTRAAAFRTKSDRASLLVLYKIASCEV